MKRHGSILVIALPLASVLAACGGSSADGHCSIADNGDGTSTLTCPGGESVTFPNSDSSPATLVDAVAEPAGPNCASGGTAIHAGPDADGDGVLDDAEISSTVYVCNGADGADSTPILVGVEEEPAGANCAQGGLAVMVGPDADGDGTLDAGEVTDTSYVCDGAAGTDGEDAVATLVRVEEELPGLNCEAGGQAILVGPDTDADGTLDDAEVASTTYACNGADGADGADGVATLVRVDEVAPGAICALGGQAILVVPDADGDGVLDDSEVVSTSYVCSGIATRLIPGDTSIVITRDGWSVQCLMWVGNTCYYAQVKVDCVVCGYANCDTWHSVTVWNNPDQRTTTNLCAIATGDATVVSEGTWGAAPAPRACGWYDSTHPICESDRATYSAPVAGVDPAAGLLLDESYCSSDTTLLAFECAGW